MEDEMSRKEITTMANGLRKLLKRARKQITNNSNRRFNRFGNRLKVEELEERIAPAGLTGAGGVVSGAVATLDADNEYVQATLVNGDVWDIGLDTGGAALGNDILITFDDAANPTDIVSIDFGNGGVNTADVNLVFERSTDTVSADLTIDSIVDTSANTGTISIFGTAAANDLTDGAVETDVDDTESGLVNVTSLNLYSSTGGLAILNIGDVTSLTAQEVTTSMRVGAVGATGITATTSFVGTLTVTGSLAGPVTSALTLGATTLEAGSTAAGDITATTGNIGAVTLGDAADDDTLVFAGDIVSTAGSIASISGTDETSITISGAVTAGTSVGTIGTHIQDVSGTITAGTTVGAITVLNDLSSIITGTSVGAIDATNDFTGAITASTTNVKSSIRPQYQTGILPFEWSPCRSRGPEAEITSGRAVFLLLFATGSRCAGRQPSLYIQLDSTKILLVAYYRLLQCRKKPLGSVIIQYQPLVNFYSLIFPRKRVRIQCKINYNFLWRACYPAKIRI